MPSSSHPRKDEEPQSEYQKTKALCLSVAPEEILRKDQPPEEQGVAEHVFVKCGKVWLNCGVIAEGGIRTDEFVVTKVF